MNWLWQEFLSLFLSRPCPLCQRSSPRLLCPSCERQLQQSGLPLDHCDREWEGSLPLFAWGCYDDTLKRAIAALKYEKQPQLALLLGRWMAESWRQAQKNSNPNIQNKTRLTQTDRLSEPLQPLSGRLTVVPIPLHASKLKQRGFNQAALLAQVFCRYTGLAYLETGLLRVKATEAQFGLSKQARQDNVTDAFQVSPALLRRQGQIQILLLDDIFTTGATARSAQQALEQAQIPVYGMVALARTGQLIDRT